MGRRKKRIDSPDPIECKTIDEAMMTASKLSEALSCHIYIIKMKNMEELYFVQDTNLHQESTEELLKTFLNGIEIVKEKPDNTCDLHYLNLYFNAPCKINGKNVSFIQSIDVKKGLVHFVNGETAKPEVVQLYLKSLSDLGYTDELKKIADKCIVERNYTEKILRETITFSHILPARKWKISEIASLLSELRKKGYDCDDLLSTKKAINHKYL